MQLPRLLSSRAKADSGSAVVDFLLITVPVSFGCLVLLGLFGSWESLIVRAEQAVEVARYSALADVTEEQREHFRTVNLGEGSIVRLESPTFCSYQVSKTDQIDLLGWPEKLSVSISREVSCEISK